MAGDATSDGRPVGGESAPGFKPCVQCGRVIPDHRMLCSQCVAGETPPEARTDSEVGASEEDGATASCKRCGATVAFGQTLCSDCWSSSSDREISEASEPDPIPHPGLAHKYRPASTLAIALRALFAAWLLLEAFALGALIVLYRMLDTLTDNPLAYAFATVDDRLELWNALWIVELIFSISLIVFFIMWFFRAYGNLMALGSRGASFGRGWAIGGWFVPFANLVIPWRIAGEIWSSADPGAEPGTMWKHKPIDWRIHVWWVAYIVGRTVLIFVNYGEEEALMPEELLTPIIWSIVALLILAVSAVCAVWMVSRATSRQTAAATATGRPMSDRDASAGLKWQMIAMPVLGVLVAVGSYFFFLVEDSSAQVGAPSSEGRSAYSGFGITFEYDDEMIAIEQGVIGTEPTEFAGGVLMSTPDQANVGMVLWFDVPDSMLPSGDIVATLIEEMAFGVGEDTVVAMSDPIAVQGPTEFVARTFRFDGFGFASGAVGFGRCLDGRGVQVVYLEEGIAHFDAEGTGAQNPYLLELTEMIKSLDC